MADKTLLESQQVIVRAIIDDLSSGHDKIIQRLTDDVGLSADVMPNHHLSTFYRAAQRVWLDSIGGDASYTIPNVLTEVEQVYRHNGYAKEAESLVQGWRAKMGSVDIGGDPVKHAKILKDAKAREKAKQILKKYQPKIHESRNIDLVVADLIESLRGLSSERGHAMTLDEVIEQERAGHSAPQSCGYKRLDGKGITGPLAVKGYPSGGWTAGRLVTCVGAPGVGKSSLGANFVARRTEMGKPSVVHSFELDKASIYRTIICSMSGCTPNQAFSPTDDLDKEIGAAVEWSREVIRELVVVYDEPTNIAGLKRRFQRHQTGFSGELVLHVVDHLGAFAGRQSGRIWEQFITLGRVFKEDLASAHDAAVFLLAHGSPKMENEFRENNRVSGNTVDAYGGQAIRQWSDVLFAVGRHNGDTEFGKDPNLATATVIQGIKNRQGKGHDDTWVVFDYDPRSDYLSNKVLADDHAELFEERPDDPAF